MIKCLIHAVKVESMQVYYKVYLTDSFKEICSDIENIKEIMLCAGYHLNIKVMIRIIFKSQELRFKLTSCST